MVEATAITEAEGSEFYEEFLVEQDVVGSQEAFEKLSAHIQKTQKNSEPSEP